MTFRSVQTTAWYTRIFVLGPETQNCATASFLALGSILVAFRVFRRRPELWGYVWRPMLWSLAILAALLVASFAFLVPWLSGLVAGPAVLAGVASFSIILLVWVFVGGPVFVTVAITASAMMWDSLSREVEASVSGHVANRPPGRVAGFVDTLLRFALAGSMAVVGLVLSFFVPVVVPILIGAFLGLHDFTAPSFGRRGVLIGQQLRLAWRLPGALSFGIACGVIGVVPVLNLLMLPILVAAGTILLNRGVLALPAEVRH
ncbi:MAG: EI24 domain-containing protein [Fimbriimonas sp.]